jgi:hypothetical protein
MDIDDDGGRPEFGLRGQRRGTESDKGTAANSLSGYRAPGLKKVLTCLRPWSGYNEAECKTPPPSQFFTAAVKCFQYRGERPDVCCSKLAEI